MDSKASDIWRPNVSIVAPCYNEEIGLPEFIRRAVAAGEKSARGSFEVVLVDDGSRDGTWEAIEKASHGNRFIVGVKLMRNHGHQLAASAGLEIARGERILLIDADLQDPPELLEQMMAIMDGGANVVYGTRISREGETLWKKATAAAFYRIFSRVANMTIPLDSGDFRLMNRRVVDVLNAMPERHRFIRGMVSWIGGKQVALPYHRDRRHAGTTKYPFSKMVSFAIDAITSFSTFPLRVAVWFGIMAAGISALVIAYALIQWLRGDVVSGWTSVIGVLAFFSGVQLVVIGIIGEYLGRLVEQSKGRPLVLIDQVCGRSSETRYGSWASHVSSAPDS